MIGDEWQLETDTLEISFKVGKNKIIAIKNGNEAKRASITGARQAGVTPFAFSGVILKASDDAPDPDGIKLIEWLENDLTSRSVVGNAA